jgi:hypothetical protein
MTADMIIDDDGEPWPLDSAELARRLGCHDLHLGLADFAVAQRGFIHIRPIETGVRVGLRPGAFSPVTLAGALQVLNDLSPRRILLVAGSGQDRMAEIFTSIFEFVERAEELASNPPVEAKVPRLSVPRGLHNLTTARFAAARPIVELWRESRGELTDEVRRAVIFQPMFRRTLLVRRLARSEKLVTEHVSPGFAHMRSCEILRILGRDVADVPDRDYGAWVADAYLATSLGQRLQIDSIRARVRASSGITFLTRYDRLLLPWRRASDVFAMGVSLLRSLSTSA